MADDSGNSIITLADSPPPRGTVNEEDVRPADTAGYPAVVGAAQPTLKDDLSNSQIQWSVSADGNTFWGSGQVQQNIPAGLYRTEFHDQIGLVLVKQIISTDTLIELADSASLEIVAEIKKFWDNEAEFTKRGLLHKRGIMLMGDPGAGKTSTIQLVIKHMIDNNGIVLFPDPNNPEIVAGAMQMIRRLEKDRPILLILEDFETIISSAHSENTWLAILDGEQQVNNIIFLATTNYISKLDKRFVDRPSRFDVIKQINMPTDAMRKQYINNKEPSMKVDQVERWVEKTKGLSIAHIKELIVSVICLGGDFDDTINRLKVMRERRYDEKDFIDRSDRKLGFQK